MKFQKTHVLIATFIVFWIIVIGWGMLKTSFKLFKERGGITALPKKDSTQEEMQAKEVTVPAPAIQREITSVMVRVFKVKPTDFQDILPVMGTIKGKTEIEFKFEINGVIEKIYFREGGKIKKGDLIANLNPKDAQLKLSYAENKLNSAQAAYNSLKKKTEVHKKLFEAGAIIKSKLEEVELEAESAKFQIETARSEMELASNEVRKTSLYSPRDGVMGPREAEEGEFITPQDKLGLLLETSEIYVEVGVVERDINKIRLGQKAKVYVDSYPAKAFEGTVDNIFPIVEGKSRTLTAKIKVANPEGLLMPGMFSRAEIFIAELRAALIVPSICLISAGKGLTLIPVIPKETIQKKGPEEAQTGLVELRQAVLGYVTTDYAQVTEGLAAEDLVVVEAQGEIKDNIQVKIIGIEEYGL